MGPAESSKLLDKKNLSKWEKLATEKQDYSSFLSNFNPRNQNDVVTRVIVLRDLQLKRIDHFLSLERNKNSVMRMEAIQQYKDHLENLDKASIDILNQLV